MQSGGIELLLQSAEIKRETLASIRLIQGLFFMLCSEDDLQQPEKEAQTFSPLTWTKSSEIDLSPSGFGAGRKRET